MADGGDLSQEQTEMLLHFQELTGIDDMERCKELLHRNNWDMEIAVQEQMSEQEGTSSIFHEPRTPLVPEQPQVNLHPVDQRVYTYNRRRPQSIMGWIFFAAFFPFRFVYSTFVDVFRFLLSFLRPDPRRRITDPLGDVLRFIQSFTDTYGPIYPNFYRGTYSQALNDAKRDLQFMLVYLHGDNHQETDDFCRNVLCNRHVVDFINGRTLFWACSTNSPEGYRVSQALRETTYPFLALITLRQNRMTVVARIEGSIESPELLARLSRIMDDNEASLLAARIDREERSFNQSLREQQDAAYLESLRADQEKERVRRESIEVQQRAEQLERDRLRDEKMKSQDLVRRKDQLRNELPLEPDADDPHAIKLLLKMPNGIRLERRFLKTDSLQALFNYVFVHESAPDDFQIVTNFPRRILPCPPTVDCPQPPSFQDFGIGRSETLFVHDNQA